MSSRLLPALLVLAACGGTGAPVRLPASFEDAGLGPPELAVIQGAEAVGYVGPADTPFEVRPRTPDLDQFPCASCHSEPVNAGGRGDEEHADVRPAHPSELAERCDACHGPDPALLQLQNGETADLDEAYRLCAQCHYAQADDWAGGAHGKRLAGWRGRRVVMSCTECHDPHSPGFRQRIPFRGPRIPRTGGAHR